MLEYTSQKFQEMITIKAQVKSRERVASHGEVFTAEREVKAMCDLVDEECRKYDSTFLEPACGDGNFLAEILTRKLSSITEDYERKSLIALSSLYGIDILSDNVQTCQKRLYDIWSSSHEFSQLAKIQAARILQNNIVCGNSLKPDTITFTEWTFRDDDIVPEGKEFILASLMKEDSRQIAIDFEE